MALVCAFTLLVPPVDARNRKGDKLIKQGVKAESDKDYDGALAFYDQAVATDPNEAAYLLPDQRMRGRAADAHETQGRSLRNAGKLDEALAQFQKAFLADPSSAIALQDIRDTTNMIKQRNAGPPGMVVLTPAQKARQETERRINSLEGPPVLRPINTQITTLKINNQPARFLYESVGKLAGINVLQDPAGIETVAGKNFNLDLNNVTLEEALDYISLETHTFWKPISHNAIFVTQESEPKRQEYQDEVVKVFYIQNASTANEFTEVFNAVRTGARLTTGIFNIPSQNAIVARGSVDQIALVEKLVHDLDHPKAEVVVDVIVMQVNRTKSTTIGASILGQGGFQQPLTFTPRKPSTTGSTTNTTSGSSTTTTGTTGTTTSGSGNTSAGGTTSTTTSSNLLTIAQAGRFSSADYSTSFPSTVVQALLNDASTRILQRPQVRSTDGGKASFLVGSQIPYVSGSLSSVVNTGSVPYATTQFQQVNVGTQIEFAPHVNGTEDISMHVKVELSNVLQRILIAGVEQPVIGKQTDEADIRMRDGEVSILGGLSDKESGLTTSGLPGTTNLPLLGYIFGSKKRDLTDNQILIAMTPHIVRSADLPNATDAGTFAGTERVIRVERNRTPSNGSMSSAPAPVNSPVANPAATQSPMAPVLGAPANPATNSTQPPAGLGSPSPLSPARNTPVVPPATTTPTGNAGPPDPIGSAAPNQNANPVTPPPNTINPPPSQQTPPRLVPRPNPQPPPQ